MIILEQEIDENLSHYEEMLSSESSSGQINKLREKLLSSLAGYEALAKDIRHLPVSGDAGCSQERIQKSIAVRAGLFLQKKMLPLKVPLKDTTPQDSVRESHINIIPDCDTDLASRLQPLLEQEAILESFISEAKSRRKFDDVSSLSTSLKEIQAEIKRLSQLVIS